MMMLNILSLKIHIISRCAIPGIKKQKRPTEREKNLKKMFNCFYRYQKLNRYCECDECVNSL